MLFDEEDLVIFYLTLFYMHTYLLTYYGGNLCSIVTHVLDYDFIESEFGLQLSYYV